MTGIAVALAERELKVAVGFNPRFFHAMRCVARATLDDGDTAADFDGRRRRSRDAIPLIRFPWVETHGYFHAVAPRPTVTFSPIVAVARKREAYNKRLRGESRAG